MSNTPIVYSSADASAPQLTGQVGSLVALLDALLVNGYGSKSACGWTKPSGSSGTLAAYRNSASTGSGMYFQCKDNADGSGGAKEAQIRGFEAMSDASTGTSQFPTNVQLSTGVIWHKSSAASSTTRLWWAIGCERWLYLFVDSNGGGLEQVAPYFVGGAVSMRPGDAAQFILFGSETANIGLGNSRSNLGVTVLPSATPSATSGAWIARNYAQVPGGVRCQPVQGTSGGVYWGGVGFAYPFEVNNGIVFERGYVGEGAWRVRCRMPGLYVSLHSAASITDLTAFPSVPGLASTDFVLKRVRAGAYNVGTGDGALFFDVTNAD